MRAVVQRVLRASVAVDGHVVGAIGRGLLVYLGLGKGDAAEARTWLLSKVVGLRIFADGEGKMSLSVGDVGGGILIVSQFTLYGDVRRGRRPSFDAAMPPEEAEAEYAACVAYAQSLGVPIATGTFRADMSVDSVNDGPVTIWLDSSARHDPRSG